METKLKNARHPLTENQTNFRKHPDFLLNWGIVQPQPAREFTGALIDFQISGKFITVSRSKKVREFLKVANTWTSGYPMGETIIIDVNMLGQDEPLSFLVKDTRLAYSKAKANGNLQYGNLTLRIDMDADGRGRYSVIENSKKGMPSYKDVLTDLQGKQPTSQ